MQLGRGGGRPLIHSARFVPVLGKRLDLSLRRFHRVSFELRKYNFMLLLFFFQEWLSPP